MRSSTHLGRLLACLLLWSAVFVASSFAGVVDNAGEPMGKSAAKAATLSVAAEFDAGEVLGATSDFDAADAFPVWEWQAFSLAFETRRIRTVIEPLGDSRPSTLVGVVVFHL